jgi:glucokinase
MLWLTTFHSRAMKEIYLGTDSGATTSKTCGVFADETPISLKLAQSSTNSQLGTTAVIEGWIEGIDKFLNANGLLWDQVRGVGLAIPGPYQRYGVLDRSANLPPAFAGWDFHADYSQALAKRAGRAISLVAGNDGNYGGVAEAAKVRAGKKASVIMLAPGSGLGAAYISPDGLPLDGDTLAGMEAGHMPAPIHLLGLPAFTCGCGRTWGCFEAYTALSGLPQFLDYLASKYPDHELMQSADSAKEKAFSLRGRAQKGDPLALEIFDYQAKALGLHVANLSIALDAEFVVIGGGLIDPDATTEAFRNRYLGAIYTAAEPWLFPVQRQVIKIVPASMGELSQAIGAALVALYTEQQQAKK